VNGADLRDQLQAALAGAFTVEREIGRGGMATVFLARDEKHERLVAIKVLRPEFAATLGPERFRREITLAAGLQHPHILPVFDSGETPEGLLWFSMPFVAGESLRERLRREQRLPFEDALRLTHELAAALDYAHRRGVVHRDVKPENVMLTGEGEVLLADFGIARSIASGAQSATRSGGDALTETGFAVGTPAYMSPEQASGERTIDARSDIFSLGAVAYEMLAGEPPFIASTPQAMIAKMLVTVAPSVRVVRPAVPAGVDLAIRRALAQHPGDRFASATDFATALEAGRAQIDPPTPRRRIPWTAALAGAVLLALVLVGAYASRSLFGGPRVPTVAVLPFDNLGDSSDAYFADGITDEVRGKLAALHGLRVIASGSSERYRHSGKSQQQIAGELGVQYLLVGHVRWLRHGPGGDRVRVDPELVHVGTSGEPETTWQEGFDDVLSDVFAVQTRIASEVADQLRVRLGSGERATLADQPTRNLDAYDAYLRGQSYAVHGNDPGAQRRAAAAYREAVQLDTGFAVAWAALSATYSNLYGMQPAPAMEDSARIAGETAVRVKPTLPEAHAALSYYYTAVRRDLPRALAEVELGRRLAPNNAALLQRQGYAEGHLGHWDAAVAHLDTAARLDPRDDGILGDLGLTLLYARRPADAAVTLDRALALEPTNVTHVEWRMLVALSLGDLAGAHAVQHAALANVDTTTLVSYIASVRDLGWALDAPLQGVLRGLGPAAFDDDRATWGLALAEEASRRGDSAAMRAYADTALRALPAQLVSTHNDPETHAHYGIALAYLGRDSAAIAAGRAAVAEEPASVDSRGGVLIQHLLVRIYLYTGHADRAIAELQPLLAAPGYLTPAWLQIDPDFAAVRRTPAFARLAASP